MDIKRSGSQPSGKGPAEYFTGTVRIDPLFQANAPSHTSGAYVTFEPGARSAWHTHPPGQTLIVTAGLGRVQRWGGPIEEIRQGDAVWIPPGQKHWHGASPNTAMTHIAIQEHVDGKVVEWMEKVSDALCRMEVDANGCDRTTRSHNHLIRNDNVDVAGRGVRGPSLRQEYIKPPARRLFCCATHSAVIKVNNASLPRVSDTPTPFAQGLPRSSHQKSTIHKTNDRYFQSKLALLRASYILIGTMHEQRRQEMFKPKAATQRCVLLAGDSVKTAGGRTKTQVSE
jgi:quercetin dioxygenase-like cupin family protein